MVTFPSRVGTSILAPDNASDRVTGTSTWMLSPWRVKKGCGTMCTLRIASPGGAPFHPGSPCPLSRIDWLSPMPAGMLTSSVFPPPSVSRRLPPLGSIDEGYVDGVGTVRARLPRLSGPSIREQLRKKALGIGERISEATGAPEVKRRPAARAGACTRVVKPGTAFAALGIDVAAVEGGAFLLVTEKIVSSGDGRKFFRDRLVARVQIGVEFFGEDAIRLFDVRLGRVGGNA